MDIDSQHKLSPKQNIWLAVKFTLFSISAGLIEFGSYFVLNKFTDIDRYLGLNAVFGNKYGLTYFIALALSVLWNFTFNRRFTFKSAANVPAAMLKVFCYYLVFTPLSIWWTVYLTDIGWNEYVVILCTMVINLGTEFSFCRFVVYRKSLYTNESGQRELFGKSGENNT
ncbi:MAG: GtrA family protein [Clostridiales bacterium]|jgi:putative flippase GtrA|nr:GtrA family protein [Clostridiales bacterium]